MCSPSAFLRGLVSLLRVGDRRRLRTRPVPAAASRHHLAGDDKSGIAGRRSPSLWRRRPRPPFRPAGPVRTSGAVGCAPARGSRNGTGRRSPWPAATSGVRGVAWSGHAGLRLPRCGGGRAAPGLAGRGGSGVGGSFAGRRVTPGAARSMVLGRLGPTGHRHRTRPRLTPPEAERLEWRRHRQPVGACRPTHNSVAVHGGTPESKALPVRPGPLACPRFSRQRDAAKRTPRPPGGCRHAPGAWFLSRRVGGPNLSIGLPTLGTVAIFEG